RRSRRPGPVRAMPSTCPFRDGNAGQLRRRHLHGLDDLDVTGAATNVTREGFADLRVAGTWVLVEQSLGGHQEARRAEAALAATGRRPRFLQRMKRRAALEPLDGGDPRPDRVESESEAGEPRAPIDEDRAAPAGPHVAPALRA